MFQRILVPLDGSSIAEQALPVAARIARAMHGSLLLLRIVTTLSDYSMYFDESSLLMQGSVEDDMSDATTYLAQIAESDVVAGIETSTAIFSGRPAECILDVAHQQQTDLIVMCSHGETGFRRWALGSIAQKVARHSAAPLLILNAKGTPLSHLFSEQFHSLRALVALDGSPEAEAVVKPVASLVSTLSEPSPGKLHLLRVVSFPHYATVWRSRAALDMEIMDQTLHDAETYIRSATERTHAIAKTSSLIVTSSVHTDADIANEILRTAELQDVTTQDRENSFDLIAMTTHGRSGIARWAIGSIAERVLEATHLPLLMVRSKMP